MNILLNIMLDIRYLLDIEFTLAHNNHSIKTFSDQNYSHLLFECMTRHYLV